MLVILPSYTVSGSKCNPSPDKAGNASSSERYPNVAPPNGLKTFRQEAVKTSQPTRSPHLALVVIRAVGVFQWNAVNDTRDSFRSTENNTVNAVTNKRDYAVSAGNSSQFNGELDLDSLSSNRISTTIGDKEAFHQCIW